jgi:hypothetical protein
MARLGYTKIRSLLTRPTCVLDQCRLLARSRFNSQCSGNDLLPGTSCALLEVRRFDDCARRSLSRNPTWRLRHPGNRPWIWGRNQNTRDQGARGGTSSRGADLSLVCVMGCPGDCSAGCLVCLRGLCRLHSAHRATSARRVCRESVTKTVRVQVVAVPLSDTNGSATAAHYPSTPLLGSRPRELPLSDYVFEPQL